MTQTEEYNRLLIVDDNTFNLDIINEYMEDEGFETLCVENGVAAWKYLNENVGSIDIILLDRMMPHMNGLELVSRLKNDVRFRNIPIIMVTAAAGQSKANEGKKAGVYEYITKPFERDTLLATVRRAVDFLKAEE